MGMSASQARYLCLIARLSDLEFQGQQINQSRTTLSDQTNNLFTQLQNLDVPTPPLTNDYTTLVYTTNSKDATKYTLGNIRPSANSNNSYNVDLNYTAIGDSLQDVSGKSTISYSDTTTKATKIKPNGNTGDYKEAKDKKPEFYLELGNSISGSDLEAAYNTAIEEGDTRSIGEFLADYAVDFGNGNIVATTGQDSFNTNAKYYKIVSVGEYNNFTDDKKAEDDYTGFINPGSLTISKAELNEYYVFDGKDTKPLSYYSSCISDNGDGTCTIVDEDLLNTIYKLDSNGSETITNPNPNQLLIGGNKAYTWDEAQKEFDGKIAWADYERAIRNTHGENAKLSDFYYVITQNKSGSFDVTLYPIVEVAAQADTPNPGVTGKKYATGEYTETRSQDDVELEFNSSGIITKIGLPIYDNDGKIKEWKYYDVTASTVTDQAAYEQAMLEYEHDKFVYDQEQTKINAQISIIQSQDKKLELKLQRLDNERTQITTELDALKKVIGDSTERGYKTFSG